MHQLGPVKALSTLPIRGRNVIPERYHEDPVRFCKKKKKSPEALLIKEALLTSIEDTIFPVARILRPCRIVHRINRHRRPENPFLRTRRELPLIALCVVLFVTLFKTVPKSATRCLF